MAERKTQLDRGRRYKLHTFLGKMPDVQAKSEIVKVLKNLGEKI